MWNWLTNLKLRWATRSSAGQPGTLGVPLEQHEQLSDREKWRREHGYSAAFSPDEWSEDIARHNAEVEKEYQQEVETRRAAYMAGTYKPRFLMTGSFVYDAVLAGVALAEFTPAEIVGCIDWDLELSADPGRRINVTKDTGKPLIPVLSDSDVSLQKQIDRYAGAMAKMAHLQAGGPSLYQSARDSNHKIVVPPRRTVRDLIGSRESILLAVGNNREMADQVERHALNMFGVKSLDEPVPMEKG